MTKTTYSGWGRALRVDGTINRPLTIAELTTTAPAVGNRRSYGDAPLNADRTVQDLTALDQILSFDRTKGQLTVQAGITIGELARILAPQGWLPHPKMRNFGNPLVVV